MFRRLRYLLESDPAETVPQAPVPLRIRSCRNCSAGSSTLESDRAETVPQAPVPLKIRSCRNCSAGSSTLESDRAETVPQAPVPLRIRSCRNCSAGSSTPSNQIVQKLFRRLWYRIESDPAEFDATWIQIPWRGEANSSRLPTKRWWLGSDYCGLVRIWKAL
jgi:hypothetical protein